MIRLPYTGTYSLELVTAQNGAQVTVGYSDATGTAYAGGVQVAAITSATTTTICATPAAATVRDVDAISIKNTYAGSHTVTVQVDANGTNYPVITAALQADESLHYTHGSGWQCKDANGNTKSGVLTSMTSAQLAAIITDETGSGALVFGTSPVLTTPDINGGTVDSAAIGATTPSTGAFTTLSSTGNATLGDSIIFDAHTLNGATTLNSAEFAAISASLPTLSYVASCFHLEMHDTVKWRKRKGQSWRSETRYTGRYSGASYASATAAYTAGLTGSGTTGDIYYQTGGTPGFYAMTGVNTSTIIYRAGREDYPTNALITAEAARVIIWDLDGAVPSMWMVFTGLLGTWGTTAGFINGTTVSSIAAANQNVAVGIGAVASTGLYVANFMADEGYGYRTTAAQGRGMFNGNIATRNSSTGYTTVVATSQLVSDTVNDVAITVLPDAPLDEYGMPVPTIFVATDAGVSVINNNGTVADLVDVAGDATNEVVFDRNNNCYFTNETQGDLDMFLASNYDADDTTPDANYDNATIPALLAAITATKQGLVATKDSIVAGHSTGMSVLLPSTASKANGMVAYITSTYNTGFMVGDIRGAWLANSATADRSVKANTLTEVGTVTVGTTLAVNDFSGWAAGVHVYRASDADWDTLGTGSVCMMGWVYYTATGGATQTIINFANAAGVRLWAYISFTGSLEVIDDGATANVTTASGSVLPTNSWHHFAFVRTSSTSRALYVDGVLVASNTTDAGSITDTGNLPLYIGVYARDGTSYPATNCKFALLRMGATAPTAEHIKHIYATEAPLFVAGNTCMLSNSNTVSALSYDKDTDTYLVGNGTNVDTFQGLKRIASAAHGVTTLTALDGGNGRTLTAGTGATYTAPERNISAELLEAQTTKPRTQNYSFTSSGTTQALPKGWKAQGIAFNTTDSTFLGTYTQSFDGFVWTMAGLTASKAYQIQLVEA